MPVVLKTLVRVRENPRPSLSHSMQLTSQVDFVGETERNADKDMKHENRG